MEITLTVANIKYFVALIAAVVGLPIAIGYTIWNLMIYANTQKEEFRYNSKTGIVCMFVALAVMLLFNM